MRDLHVFQEFVAQRGDFSSGDAIPGSARGGENLDNLLFDRERELMVIPYADYGSFRDTSRDFDNLFIVYNVNLEDGIVERLHIKQQVHGSSAYLYSINQRSLYIGDTLFLHYGNRIDAYNLNSLSMLDGVNVTD